MAQPSTATVRFGAGTLSIAPLGTAEPTSVSSVDAGFINLGYTEAGSTFTSTPAITALDVAELYRPVRNIVTGITERVTFSLAEMSYANVVAAFNGGVANVTGGTPVTFEPPDLGTEVRVMLLWTSQDGLEKWLYRQVFQIGAVAIARAKTAKAMIPVEFELEQPSASVRTWKAWFAGSLASA